MHFINNEVVFTLIINASEHFRVVKQGVAAEMRFLCN